MTQSRQQRLQKLKALYEQGHLTHSDYAAMLADMGATTAELHGSGAIAQGDGAKAVSAGGVLVEGNVGGGISITNNRYDGPPPTDDTAKRHIYLKVLARMVSRLPMRTFDAGQSSATGAQQEINLANVYTELDTTTQVEDERAKENKDKREQAGRPERATRPLRALEALNQHAQLVLLGEPGSGKSTFVHHVVACLALLGTEPNALGMEAFNRDWQVRPAPLPVRVILRDFDAWLRSQLPTPRRAQPHHLCDFIAQQLDQQNLSFAMPLIHQALDKGAAFILLDGLDEVTSVPQRVFVRDAIHALAARYADNRYLVTCRTWAYQKPDPGQPDLRLDDKQFPTAELARFDDKKIERFVVAWHTELVRADKLSQAKADFLQPKLLDAVRNRRDLKRLAPNPLQLTLMAWVHTFDEALPDKRAKLYAQALDLLLWKWEAHKRDDGTPTLQDLVTGVDASAGSGKDAIERELAKAAFEAHAQITPAEQGDNPEKLADLSEPRLKAAIAKLKRDGQGKPDENFARDVVDAIKERSGLLAQRLPETLTFPHRTFQEYLTALCLLQGGDFVVQANTLAEQFAVWREVILLAAGYEAHVSKLGIANSLALVRKLCPAQLPNTDVVWRKVWLAGEVLSEIGATRAEAMDDETVTRVRERLVTLIEGAHLPPAERAQAGNALAHIGDPRQYVTQCDAMHFQFVPAGKFVMGSKDDKLKVFGKETPQWQPEVPEFYISRHPVTNAQFEAFVATGGYANPNYWAEAEPLGYWLRAEGKVKRSFAEQDDKGEYVVKEETDNRPAHFGEPFNLPNHPVVGVSWFEALAFTRWLSEQWGVTVRLPSEIEWEKAARGPLSLAQLGALARQHFTIDQIRRDEGSHFVGANKPSQGSGLFKKSGPLNQRVYPWGDEFDSNFVNTFESDIDATSPTGCFALGASPYGCEDMSGNVWEWCATKHQDDYHNYKDDFRPDKEARVLRGGAFDFIDQFSRCAARDDYDPIDRNRDVGFRLVVSRLSSYTAGR